MQTHAKVGQWWRNGEGDGAVLSFAALQRMLHTFSQAIARIDAGSSNFWVGHIESMKKKRVLIEKSRKGGARNPCAAFWAFFLIGCRVSMPFLANCMLPIIAYNDILSPMDGVEKAPSTTTRCTMKRPTAAVPASTSHESPNWFLLRNSKWKYAFSMQKKHNSLKYGSFCFFLVVLGKDWLTSSSLGHWTKQPKRNGRCWWRNNCTSW